MLKAATVGCAAPGCVQAPRPGVPDVIGAAATARHEPSWLIPSPAGDGHGDRNEQSDAPVAPAVPPTSARRRHAGTGFGTAASTRAGVGPIYHSRLRTHSMPAAHCCPQSCQQHRPRGCDNSGLSAVETMAADAEV